MATLLCSAKSINKWSLNELEAYNISITFQQDAQTFFNKRPLPTPSEVPQEFLMPPTYKDAADNVSSHLLTQFNYAMMPDKPDNLAVIDFAQVFFYSIRYVYHSRGLHTHKELWFFTCREVKHIK